MSNAIIRKAVPADLNAIGELWREYMDFHQARDPHFARASDGHERFLEYISGHMASATSCVLVAEQDGRIVGYCLSGLTQFPPSFADRDYGTVFDLAVTARCRRSGIGRDLYQRTEAWFVERGIHRIETRVAVTNEISTAFWKKTGFRPYVTGVFKSI